MRSRSRILDERNDSHSLGGGQSLDEKAEHESSLMSVILR
jgi:hypothetical protein